MISLFTGAGGLDFGFEAAGFQMAVGVEIDVDCCASLRRSRPWWRVINESIFEVSSRRILREAQLRRGEADVVIGGPPCQPFSKSGYWVRGDALRLDDPRANTLAGYMRVVEDTLPKAFLLENVLGLAYSGKDEGLQFLLDRVEAINKKRGTRYDPKVAVLNAADHGVPQLRERVFVVAGRDGQSFAFPPRTHAPREERTAPGLQPYRNAWDAIGELREDASEDLRVRGKWAELLPSIPEGSNYLHHTDRGSGLPLFGWRRRYWSFLLKLAKDRPSWTIQAQPGPSVGPFHWCNRRLSTRELCRLQTFPDDVVILGGRGSAQKQVGNAVPSLLAEAIAREVRTQLLGLRPLRRQSQLMPLVREPVPPPEPSLPVPPKYLHLRGAHAPHPGTGRGAGARVRRLLR